MFLQTLARRLCPNDSSAILVRKDGGLDFNQKEYLRIIAAEEPTGGPGRNNDFREWSNKVCPSVSHTTDVSSTTNPQAMMLWIL
jgi:hypothetical protein